MKRDSLGWAAALVAGLAVGGCGGAALQPQGSTDPATPAIPPFPDLCSRLQIQYAGGSCGAGCGRLACSCPSVAYTPCSTEQGCVTSVDCAAACENEQLGLFDLLTDCVGYCKPGDDCGNGATCFALPGATGGICGFDRVCLDDGNCLQGGRCVAVRADGVRSCSGGSGGEPCNNTRDCAAGLRCAVPDASFLGFCSQGDNADLCYRDSDCRSGRRCLAAADIFWSVDVKPGRCSDGSDMALCGSDADCRKGKCIASQCSSGQLYDACAVQEDCASSLFCIGGYCRDGSLQSICEQSSQCVSGLYCAKGLCSDGTPGSLCEQDSQCASGRCAQSRDSPECTTGAPGAPCMDEGDCSSAVCRRAIGAYDWELGTCD